jgi:hypothetical protein
LQLYLIHNQQHHSWQTQRDGVTTGLSIAGNKHTNTKKNSQFSSSPLQDKEFYDIRHMEELRIYFLGIL